jgi:GNAT superfamily N-acetyltransferase
VSVTSTARPCYDAGARPGGAKAGAHVEIGKRRKMIEIRDKMEPDAAALRPLVDGATQELRKIYRPGSEGSPPPSETANALVATEGGRIVGVAEYVFGDDEVLVQGVAVHPDYRRRGVARALIAGIERVARERGMSRLALRTIRQTGNPSIFCRLGFTIVGEQPSRRFQSPTGGEVVEVLMVRPLSLIS